MILASHGGLEILYRRQTMIKNEQNVKALALLDISDMLTKCIDEILSCEKNANSEQNNILMKAWTVK